MLGQVELVRVWFVVNTLVKIAHPHGGFEAVGLALHAGLLKLQPRGTELAASIIFMDSLWVTQAGASCPVIMVVICDGQQSWVALCAGLCPDPLGVSVGNHGPHGCCGFCVSRQHMAACTVHAT